MFSGFKLARRRIIWKAITTLPWRAWWPSLSRRLIPRVTSSSGNFSVAARTSNRKWTSWSASWPGLWLLVIITGCLRVIGNWLRSSGTRVISHLRSKQTKLSACVIFFKPNFPGNPHTWRQRFLISTPSRTVRKKILMSRYDIFSVSNVIEMVKIFSLMMPTTSWGQKRLKVSGTCITSQETKLTKTGDGKYSR